MILFLVIVFIYYKQLVTSMYLFDFLGAKNIYTKVYMCIIVKD